jgi:tripartite-type tricarboxylate transporter receptor subunit TctC
VTGIGAPANTPVEIIDRLNREINAAFTDPSMKARLLDTGGGAGLADSPADFGRSMAEETGKWAQVIKAYSK